MLRQVGVEYRIRVNTDASAANGIANRRGLGKVKHVQVNELWVQERVASGDIEVREVEGKSNLADLLTKHRGSEDIRVHMFCTGQRYGEERHELAPQVADDAGKG
jgi:nicotinamide mononucleotide adenylyltransferase